MNSQIRGYSLCVALLLNLFIGGCSMAAAPVGSARFDAADGNRRDDFLRSRVDFKRNLRWVLGIDEVRVYDLATKQLIRSIVLPGWNVAGFLCPPDLAIDRGGAAFVSSNITATLWRIDPDNFTVSRIGMALRTKENWDTGFGGLTFAADGALFGVTALPESLWRIDIKTATAVRVELSQPLRGACGLTATYRMRTNAPNAQLSLCVAGKRGTQRIDMASDFTRGDVHAGACDRRSNDN